jgi:hypothetical protein
LLPENSGTLIAILVASFLSCCCWLSAVAILNLFCWLIQIFLLNNQK